MKTITQIGWAIICMAGLLVSDGFAADTHKAELKAFNEARVGGSSTPEAFWTSIVKMEQFLKDYPNTFLEGDALSRLLFYYSQVTDDPALLENLADRYLKIKKYSDNAYYVAADAFIKSNARSPKALEYALKAYEGGKEKQAKWQNYETSLANRKRLVARAFQLLGKDKQAIDEMQSYLELVQKSNHPNWTLATKQGVVDQGRIELLDMYINQKMWTPAYVLGSELMQTAVVKAIGPSHRRVTLGQLWSKAYVGKHGSAKGMSQAYAALQDARDQKIVREIKKERISRPGPVFAVQTLDGRAITDQTYRGKTVVVTFWAGWCSPCIEELPYLQELKEKFRKQGVEFLAVNIDADNARRRDMVTSFRFEKAPSLTFALGDLNVRKAFGSSEIPYTCIIDSEGQIRYERKGMGADFSTAMAHQIAWVAGLQVK